MGRLNRVLTILCLAVPLSALAARPPPNEEPNEIRFGVGGADFRVSLAADLAQSELGVTHWIKDAGETVAAYYGGFPVAAVSIAVGSRVGEPVNEGTTYEGRRIVIHLDPHATRTDLREDWVLTHEMFHLGFPQVARKFHYLEEGLSDYLEPLARARLGKLSESDVWRDFIRGIPQGVPRDATGLDGARDWGRVYWGGCLFWLLVDLDIRERSDNRHSVDDAIRAIVLAGGTGDSSWSLERIIKVGDGATGTGSIRRIHQRLGVSWVAPGLPDLWRKLGVAVENDKVVFDESAPLATIRRSLTKPH